MRAIIISLALVLLIIPFGFGLWVDGQWRGDGPLVSDKLVLIDDGMNLDKIATRLEDSGVVSSAESFSLLVRLLGEQNKMKAGEYRFSRSESQQGVYERIYNHRVTLRRITIPEGWSSAQIITELKSRDDMRRDIYKRVDEGSILPDTYLFRYGIDRNDVIEIMQRAMREYVATEWSERSPSLPISTPYEMLVVASLVQKEASEFEDMRKVAGVIYNRLRDGIPLQIDSSVIYAITLGRSSLNRKLSGKDLRNPSPYNTYFNNSLPPTPIANPGRLAINAASNPALISSLYFVANDDGKHTYADTFDQHKENVYQYRLRQKQKDSQ